MQLRNIAIHGKRIKQRKAEVVGTADQMVTPPITAEEIAAAVVVEDPSTEEYKKAAAEKVAVVAEVTNDSAAMIEEAAAVVKAEEERCSVTPIESCANESAPEVSGYSLIDAMIEDSNEVVPYKEYKIKVYLNARHFIYINGKQGATHPHTWEFLLSMRFDYKTFIEFSQFEHAINGYLDKYQNQIINTIEPFHAIIPTLENITDVFAKDFCNIIIDMGGVLDRVEASETPTRTYVIDTKMLSLNESMELDRRIRAELVSNRVDVVNRRDDRPILHIV